MGRVREGVPEEITQSCRFKGGWEPAVQGTWEGRTTEWLSGQETESTRKATGKWRVRRGEWRVTELIAACLLLDW